MRDELHRVDMNQFTTYYETGRLPNPESDFRKRRPSRTITLSEVIKSKAFCDGYLGSRARRELQKAVHPLQPASTSRTLETPTQPTIKDVLLYPFEAVRSIRVVPFFRPCTLTHHSVDGYVYRARKRDHPRGFSQTIFRTARRPWPQRESSPPPNSRPEPCPATTPSAVNCRLQALIRCAANPSPGRQRGGGLTREHWPFLRL
jgi:hypothetical protein